MEIKLYAVVRLVLGCDLYSSKYGTLNAATPVGAVSNTTTSSGSTVPNCLISLVVSE